MYMTWHGIERDSKASFLLLIKEAEFVCLYYRLFCSGEVGPGWLVHEMICME